MTTCTVGPSAVTGHRCGQPSITSFVGSNGVTYHECADHAVSAPVPEDTIEVRRHGKTYSGRVHHVTRSGKVFAEVTYDNGATRVVEVDR